MVVTVAGDGMVETWVETAVEIEVAIDHDGGGGTAGESVTGPPVIGHTGAVHGTVRLVGPRRFRYLPQSGFAGIDGFGYRLAQSAGAGAAGAGTGSAGTGSAGTGDEQAQAWIGVRVKRPNRQPVAADGLAVIGRDAPVTLDVLAGASDPDGDRLRLTVLELPAFGRLEIGADQSLTYWPDATPGILEDGFGYRLEDGRGGAAEARVRLLSPPPPAPPPPPPLVARDDRVTTGRNDPVRITLLANDVAAPSRRLAALTLPRHGHVELQPDLGVTYTPEPGFTGVDDFTYTLEDEFGQQSGAVVVVQVVES
jgi:hypothetical protein